MVRPSPLPQGWGSPLTPSWEDRAGSARRRGQRRGGRALLSRPISSYNFGADAGGPRAPFQRWAWGSPRRWHRVWGLSDPTFPEVENNLPCRSQQTPPPIPPPRPPYTWFSQPTGPSPSPGTGTLQQSPGWEGRVQWAAPDKPEACAGLLEVATVEQMPRCWAAQGLARPGSAPGPEHGQN